MDMFRRKTKYYVSLTTAELRMIRISLLDWRNRLITEGRDTSPLDEMLLKLCRATPHNRRKNI